MSEIFTVAAITMLAVISPGADFAVVTRNSLLGSRRTGVMTALGVGVGSLIHVAYTLLGVGVALAASPAAFGALKLLGAAYLIWLGVTMLRARPAAPADVVGSAATGDGRAFRAGLFTNALNPKTTVFVVSLFLQIVDPSTPLAAQLGYGAFVGIAHAGWFSLVALALSTQTARARLTTARVWIDRICGGALVAFGASLARADLGH
jgi:RhtB (resistance to homoserine/threonine) family protein